MKEILEAEKAHKWMVKNYPKAVKFEPYIEDMKSIDFYITYNQPDTYGTLMYLYGILYILGLIKYFASQERYEICEQMRKAIEIHNNRYGQSLPTDIDSDEANDYMNLKPSEILATHFIIENLKSGKPL